MITASTRTAARPRAGGATRTRREEILSAARTLISENGVRGTSMRDLAKAVGVTEGAFYRHFDSKEALVTELFAAEASRLHRWLSGCMKRETEPWSQLDALVTGFVEFGLEESESFRLIMELHHLSGLKAEPAAMPRELFLAVLQQIAASEKRRLTEPKAVVLMLVGMMSRATTALRRGALKLPRARFARLIGEAARAVVSSTLEPLD